jgi:hypothetical protein
MNTRSMPTTDRRADYLPGVDFHGLPVAFEELDSAYAPADVAFFATISLTRMIRHVRAEKEHFS